MADAGGTSSSPGRLDMARATFRTSNDFELTGQVMKEPLGTVLPSREPRRMHAEGKDSIDPFPFKPGVPPKGLQGAYEVARKGNARAGEFGDLDYIDTMQRQTMDMQRSTVGRVPNGLADSRGFIISTTEKQRRQHEAFAPDTVATYKQGRQAELDIAERRKQLATQPFQSEAPQGLWNTTYKSEHVNLLPVVDRTAGETCITKPRGRPRAGAEIKLTETKAKEEVDLDKLKALRDEQLAAGRRHYKPKSTWVGGVPRSTYQDHMREFDPRECEEQMDGEAKKPVVHKKYQDIDGETTGFIEHRIQRKLAKNQGEFSTTASNSFQDRLVEAEPTTHRKAHFFEKKLGTLQMPKRGNDPLKKETNLHDTKNMADVVPSHFMTTKDLMERAALGGLAPA